MPTKAVSWTQQPVVQSDLQSVHFDRTTTGFSATATYEVRDQTSAVRFVAILTAPIAAWPSSLAAILGAINSAQGT